MKKLAALTLSLFLTTGMALADTPKDADAQPAKAPAPAKPKAAKKAEKSEKSDSAIAAEIEELRQAIQSQQEQLQLLKEELAKRDRQIDEAREAAAAANARATEASTKAVEAVNSSAELKTTAASLNTTVSDLKASNEVLKTTVAKEQAEQKKAEETGPSSLRFKGVTLTPGGFFAAESVFRTHAVSGDINTPFTGIPFPGNSLSKVTEFNATARQSRIAMLAEGKLDRAKLSGYYEMDFLSAAVTSNNRQSNSYSLRQRQFWAQVATDGGWSLTGGQMWSLATETKQGLQVRTELPPMTIDPQYNVGFTWARQYGVRLVKDFNGKFAVGVSVEGPQATIGGRGFSTATSATGATTQNFFIDAPGSAGGLFNAFDPTGYTVNKAPDLIFKVAADPGFGHYELFGILSTFRNRVYPCAVVSSQAAGVVTNADGSTTTFTGNPITCSASTTAGSAGAFNDTRTGGGVGASARVPLFNKKLDFGVKGVAGDGIGRYGSAQLADVTFRPDGTEALIRTAHGLATFEFHATPKLDIFANFGGEYAWRAGYTGYATVKTSTTLISNPNGTPGAPVLTDTTVARSTSGIGGYGNVAANNSGCSTEGVPAGTSAPSGGGTCAGDTRFIYEGTLGFWHKIYQGPHGGLRWAIQYSYFSKNAWSGAASNQPKAVNNMVWSSFRYYLP
ncbi:MAG TPA: hypothetical protein VJN89_11790 [Candidatus Acidoferrum sp.]|nr:hypothetical protein [Candidatus Acidoferrum sp.]